MPAPVFREKRMLPSDRSVASPHSCSVLSAARMGIEYVHCTFPSRTMNIVCSGLR